MSPKISVIVPVYNVEKYITRCVDSLINQTLGDLEIVLVDDGSTDQSGAICDEYASKDSRIKVLHKTNAGQGLARNDGLKIASGEYVCFLDSDDYLELVTCEELSALMESKNADMVTYGYQIDSPEGKPLNKPYIKDDEYVDTAITSEFIKHFFGDDPKDINLRGFNSCMSCFRLSVIKNNDICFPSEREVLSEDTVFCLEFCKVANKVITTSEVYYHYCQKADSFSQGYMPDKMHKTMEMHSLLSKYSKEFGVDVAIRLSMYVWVNLMASLKQEVRYSKNNAKVNIKKLVSDEAIKEQIEPLMKEALPVKQKLLLRAVLAESVGCVMLLCDIRGRLRL